MGTESTVDAQIRAVTDGEVGHIFEHGWVALPGLITPQLAAELLEAAGRVMGAEGQGHAYRPGIDDPKDPRLGDGATGPRTGGGVARFVSREDETLRTFATSASLGRNAARLLGRDSAIRLLVDSLGVKQPTPGATVAAPDAFGQGTMFNLDRRPVGFYVALDEITPEMGPLWFLDGSHVLGPMGSSSLTRERREEWVQLRACPVTAPIHLRPGDATAHLSGCASAPGENAGDRTRWAYVLGYFPADALFTGAANVRTDGLGLELFQPLDHPNFPVVYEP